MNKCVERLYNGIIKENPTFILMLGMCPTLATTTSAINGLGMGLSTTAVLMFSNLLISALRNIIPDRVRIPAFIVVVASLVTVVQLLMQGYVPSLYASLGIYIPLIVVNCIILGRAESYACKNGPSNLSAISVSGVSGPKFPRKTTRALHSALFTSSSAFSMSFSFSTVTGHS